MGESGQWEFWDFDATSSWDNDGDQSHHLLCPCHHHPSNDHDHGPSKSCPELAPIQISNMSSILIQEQRDSNNHLFASSMFKPHSDRQMHDEYFDDMISADSEQTERAGNNKIEEGEPQTTSHRHDSTPTTAAVGEFKPARIAPRLLRLASSRAGGLQQVWSPASIVDDHNSYGKDNKKKRIEPRKTIAPPEIHDALPVIEKNIRARARAA